MRARAAATLTLLLALPLGAGTRSLRFERANGTFRNMGGEILPVTEGVLTVHLDARENVLTVRDHVLDLEPLGGNLHRARLWTSFFGKALLEARIEAGGIPGRLEDEVLLPIQELSVEGVLRVERLPEGYRLTPVELPESVELLVQSRLANGLVSWCDTMSILLGGLDCSGFERAFSRVEVPLPDAGSSHLLLAEQLEPAELRQIDDYLDRSRD